MASRGTRTGLAAVVAFWALALFAHGAAAMVAWGLLPGGDKGWLYPNMFRQHGAGRFCDKKTANIEAGPAPST